jgi:hypothetical protein
MAVRRFNVAGKWPFPLDMLRYDGCWPAESEDVDKLDRLLNDTEIRVTRRFYLTLATAKHGSPTVERWQSFGWDVHWRQ